MEEEKKDLVSVEETEVSVLADDSIIALAEQAEKRIEAMRKIINASLKMTNENDWVLIGGNPYLQASGAEKVGRLFGVSWRIDEPKKVKREDGHYIISYKGWFGLSGASIEAEGARSSTDDLFLKNGKGNPDKSPDQIDERDVKISAYTNCINNGLKRLLGLRNITKEDLTNAGFDINKLRGYGFNTSAPQEQSKESKSKREEIIKMLNEASGGDSEKVKKMLTKYTSFTKQDGTEFKGYDNVNKISEKAIGIVYDKIKVAYGKWVDKQGDVEDDSKETE